VVVGKQHVEELRSALTWLNEIKETAADHVGHFGLRPLWQLGQLALCLALFMFRCADDDYLVYGPRVTQVAGSEVPFFRLPI